MINPGLFSPDKPVSMFFDACGAIDQSECGGIGCGCGGQAWKIAVSQMISVCAGKTTLGQVMMWVLIIALIRVIFHGPHGKGQNTQHSFQEDICPDCTPGT
jgi:hypothetical protein